MKHMTITAVYNHCFETINASFGQFLMNNTYLILPIPVLTPLTSLILPRCMFRNRLAVRVVSLAVVLLQRTVVGPQVTHSRGRLLVPGASKHER